MQARAAVMPEPHGRWTIETLGVAEPGPQEALVRVDVFDERLVLARSLDVHFVNPSPVLHLDMAGDCGHHQRMKMSVLPDSRQGPLPCQYLMLPQ